MSFSKDVKKEILQRDFIETKGATMFLCGLALSCGELTLKKNSLILDYITDVPELFDVIKDLIQKHYNKEAELTVAGDYKINQTLYYRIKLPKGLAKQILTAGGLINADFDSKVKNGENPISFDSSVLTDEDEIKSFVAGAYMGCGTSSIIVNADERKSTGYHIEFAHSDYNFLNELANILAQFEILAKLVKRKSIYVLYIKDAEEVSNVLALVGAYNAVLELQNEIITRSVRNKINRQTNCISSNIRKTADACYEQLVAINKIDKNIGIENLPQDLQEVALLRLANTEESLDTLLKLSKMQLTKSGLNYRLQKLIKMAEKIKG